MLRKILKPWAWAVRLSLSGLAVSRQTLYDILPERKTAVRTHVPEVVPVVRRFALL
jgi:hypothetical protein